MARFKEIRDAELLRNLITSCLKAAPDPMTSRELVDWPSIREQIGMGLPGYNRFSFQLRNMVKSGQIQQFGQGVTRTYAINHEFKKKNVVFETAELVNKELKIRVNKSQKSLTLQFEGLNITIEVADG